MPQPSILCDIGNVLVHFDFAPAAQRLAARSHLQADRILTFLDTEKVLLESGQISGEEFITRSMELTSFSGTRADFLDLWCDIFSPNEAMWRTIARLRGQLPLYLLSNTSDLHKDYLFATYPVFGNFDGGVYSYSAGSAKPDAEIFQRTIQELGIDPAQTLFIDDLAANIFTADELGFSTIRYDAANHLAFEESLNDWMLKHEIVSSPTAKS